MDPARLLEPLFWLQGERVVEFARGAAARCWVTRRGARLALRTGPVIAQTLLDLRRPWDPLGFPYRTAAAALGMVPEVKRFAMAGLGGGSFLWAVRRAFPEAELLVLEPDPAAARLCSRFFPLPEGAEVLPLRAEEYFSRPRGPFDIVFLDAFEGPRTPRGMLSRGFVSAVAASLAPGGVACANVMRRHPLDPAPRLMLALFRESFRFVAAARELPPPLPGSVVLFGTPSPETAGRDHAAALRGMAAEGRVSRRAARAARRVRWEPGGRVDSRQNAIANLI